MRKLMLLLSLAMLLAGVVAAPSMAQDDEVFRVAAVSPSATNDLAFSQSMYDALVLMQEEMGEDNFEFDFLDGVFNVDDAAVALREWAASGDYDLVIAHGSQYGSILEELAPEFPDVSFAWGTDVNTFGLENVYAYEAASDQGGYINGFVAGTLSESDVIGVIGPIEVGDAKLYVDGFVQGVADANEAATVNVNYIQSFSDVPLATEAAETHLANGADILTGTAQMVVGPIAVAVERGDILWFGTQANQAELGSEIVVMSQVYHWEIVLQDIIRNIQEEGILGGTAYTLNLENEGLQMEINEAFFESEEDLAAFQESVDELVQLVIDGEVETLPPAEGEEEESED